MDHCLENDSKRTPLPMPDTQMLFKTCLLGCRMKESCLYWVEDIVFEYCALEQLILMTKARHCLWS